MAFNSPKLAQEARKPGKQACFSGYAQILADVTPPIKKKINPFSKTAIPFEQMILISFNRYNSLDLCHMVTGHIIIDEVKSLFYSIDPG